MNNNNTINHVATTDNGLFLSSLSAAQKKDELCLFYQPRFDISTESAPVLESLMRWQRPGVGLVYPEVFTQMAEENALNFQLDLWAFERCCRDLLHLRERVNPAVKLAVNLSVLSCESVYVSQKIIDICTHHGLHVSDFVFEITGRAVTTDIRKVVAFCKTLNEYGATICVDDFGDGHLSLVDIELLPVHQLKLARPLIARVGSSERSELLIKHIIRMVLGLGLKPIALGIENSAQYTALKRAGCTDMQGNLLGTPVTLEQVCADTLLL